MLPDEEIIKSRKNLGKEKRSLDTLCNLIKIEKPEGVTAAFVVENIMKMKGVKGPMADKLALMHIGDDPRFAFENGFFKLKGGFSAKALFNAPSYCVIDIETAGKSYKDGGIVELAAVRVSDGKLTGSFSQLIDPGFPILPQNTMIHGITDDMVAEMPAVEEVLPTFLDFLGDSVFVAHNAPFDISYINESLMRKYSQKIINPVICTLKLSRMLFPKLESHTLDTMIRHFKLEAESRHRALGDATACAKVLVRMLDILKNSGSIK